MKIKQGRVYDNGFDLGVKNNTIRVRRENHRITIVDSEIGKRVFDRSIIAMIKTIAFYLIISNIFILIKNNIDESQTQLVYFIFPFVYWALSYINLKFLSKKYENRCKYLGAQNMLINFYNKYNRVPNNMDELAKVSHIYKESYINPVSLYTIGIPVIFFCHFYSFSLESYILIALGVMLLSMIVVDVLKFDFVQKIIAKKPTYKEIRIAYEISRELKKFEEK